MIKIHFKLYNKLQKEWVSTHRILLMTAMCLKDLADKATPASTELGWYYGPDYEIVWPTGIVDANNREIWSGDILRQSFQNQFSSWSFLTGVMLWHEQEARFTIRYNTAIPIADCAGPPTIIGNIFDTSHLAPKIET